MKTPPKFLIWLLDLLCPESRADLKGDFLELYDYRVETMGTFKANLKFLYDCLTVLPLRFIVKENRKSANSTFMLTTYLKIAQRNLIKNKLNAVVNLVGLSVSLAACLLITLFVRDELSFDKHFQDAEKIYRIAGNYYSGGMDRSGSAATSYMLLPLIKDNQSTIESMTRFESRWETIVINGKEKYLEPEILFADSTFFRVFAISFVAGNSTTALRNPDGVVLDESTAQKYFGLEDPMGKWIELNEKQFLVTGVIKDMPVNSHFRARIIFPMHGVSQWFQEWVTTNMSGRNMYTYIKVKPNFSSSEFETYLKKIMLLNWPNDKDPELFLQPLMSIHLKSHLLGEINDNGSEVNVYIFLVTAIMILILACVNYINLAMAGALQRSKEVGMKKVLGSTTRMQVAQFQTEAFLVTLISAVLALLIAELSMPIFNQLSGKSFELQLFTDTFIGIGLLAIVLLIGLLAGGFPALLLLRLNTMSMLTGKIKLKESKVNFRSLLIVFQFSVSVILIASTLLVINQIDYMRSKNLGVETEQLVMIPLPSSDISSRYELLKTEMLRNPNVLNVSASGGKVTNAVSGWRPYIIDWMKEDVSIPSMVVSYDFFETMKAEMTDGRPFSREHPTDLKEAFIINEAAAKMMKLEKPVDSFLFGITFNGTKWFDKNAHIIGVVKDFNLASLHSKVEPIVFSLASETTENLNWMEVRIAKNNVQETITSLEKTWSKLVAESPFQFEFMDEAIQQHYQSENQFSKIFTFFSALSILLGALGLFGLTAFMTRRRTKEVGIHKIMGASTQRLIQLLSIDFLKLVVIANLIGWPVAYYFIRHWLESFAYQTQISVWIFVGTSIAAIVVAFLAILYHSLKASLANPIIALRQD